MKDSSPSKKSSSSADKLSHFVIAAGAIAIAVAAARQSNAAQCAWLMMIALALCIAPASALRIPGVKAKITLGDVVIFTCAALFGPSAAVVAAMADGACASLRMTKSPRKFFYNVATTVTAMTAATFLASAVFPGFNSSGVRLPAMEMAAAIGVLAVVYFLISTFLIAGYLSASSREPLFRLWRENFLWTSISCGAAGISAFAAWLLIEQFGYGAFAIPTGLMLMVFFFYRAYFNKVNIASERADQMEELNLRAMETMIAAIGAVGYATKSNTRRVERLALELGRRAGCSKAEIKALRIAATLRDIGNIAVPQHILEKPCALTAKEFDLVKAHPAIGAEIVRSIGFPDQAVEIVRHHHERFDGTGYPSALAGHEIPIGARALAIVDCYNALTTDRPYRPRMSRRYALDVMREQSGAAFDPALLDKFMEIVVSTDEEACKDQAAAFQVEAIRAEPFNRRQSYKVTGGDKELQPAIAQRDGFYEASRL